MMARRSRAGGEQIKGRGRKTRTSKRGNAPKVVVRSTSSYAAKESQPFRPLRNEDRLRSARGRAVVVLLPMGVALAATFCFWNWLRSAASCALIISAIKSCSSRDSCIISGMARTG